MNRCIHKHTHTDRQTRSSQYSALGGGVTTRRTDSVGRTDGRTQIALRYARTTVDYSTTTAVPRRRPPNTSSCVPERTFCRYLLFIQQKNEKATSPSDWSALDRYSTHRRRTSVVAGRAALSSSDVDTTTATRFEFSFDVQKDDSFITNPFNPS